MMRSKLISRNEEEMITSSSYDTILNKIKSAAEGLDHFFERRLLETSRENADIIADYILALKTEINLSPGYKRTNY